MEINKREKLILTLMIIALLLNIIAVTIKLTLFNYDTTDKYNLNPKPVPTPKIQGPGLGTYGEYWMDGKLVVCAPASLNGKTVTNCLNK